MKVLLTTAYLSAIPLISAVRLLDLILMERRALRGIGSAIATAALTNTERSATV